MLRRGCTARRFAWVSTNCAGRRAGRVLSGGSGSRQLIGKPRLRIYTLHQEQERVRLVLNTMQPRQAELLLLRGHDFSYNEIAAALNIRPTSLGKLLARAQQSFRKEYIRRYGEQ